MRLALPAHKWTPGREAVPGGASTPALRSTARTSRTNERPIHETSGNHTDSASARRGNCVQMSSPRLRTSPPEEHRELEDRQPRGHPRRHSRRQCERLRRGRGHGRRPPDRRGRTNRYRRGRCARRSRACVHRAARPARVEPERAQPRGGPRPLSDRRPRRRAVRRDALPRSPRARHPCALGDRHRAPRSRRQAARPAGLRPARRRAQGDALALCDDLSRPATGPLAGRADAGHRRPLRGRPGVRLPRREDGSASSTTS